MNNQSMQHCIQVCLECHSICLETIQHCLSKAGKHADPAHIRLLSDCAQICQTSADFMLRGSNIHTDTCEVCAKTCEQCAEDCEQFKGDPDMKKCADICRQCAESCHEMAGAKV
jgi:hypothetical protein